MQTTILEPRHLDQARAIYLAAFPPDERLPVADVLEHRLLDRKVLVAREDDDDDTVLAIAVLVPHHELGADLLEYLAVDPRRRSGGVGGALLEDVVRAAGDRDVLAELEPPDSSSDAARRADFYRRHAFAPAPWQGDYVMPGPRGAVPLQLWHRSGRPSPADPRAFMERFYTRTYGARADAHLATLLAAVRQG